MAAHSSDEDTIIILSTHYVRDTRERLVSTESTAQVTVGRTHRETLIARAVAVVSLSLLTISVLLVMVSLIMSHHIDQLVRDANKDRWYLPKHYISATPFVNNSVNLTMPGS
ncbi:uncharacterized protein [Haliotis asinina]|uniref:uncharacterized protein n=1 Tax=Haliotis asinina TaxID=109174 RepID=UPI0035324652